MGRLFLTAVWTAILASAVFGQVKESGSGSIAATTQSPTTPIAAAKTIYVRQSAGNPELLVSVEKELRNWGRFTTLGSEKDADLILDLTPTANPQILMGKGAKATAILTTRDGVRVWSTVKGGDWSMAGYTFPKVGKAIVEDLKKFVTTKNKGQ